MKYEVKCAKCGESHWMDLCGKNSEREKKLAWYADNYICQECRDAAKKSEKEKNESEYHLAEIVAVSEKQKEYAEDCRSKIWKRFCENDYAAKIAIVDAMTESEKKELKDMQCKKMEEIAKYFFDRHTNAREIIDIAHDC